MKCHISYLIDKTARLLMVVDKMVVDKMAS
jgi:hypothetical protein